MLSFLPGLFRAIIAGFLYFLLTLVLIPIPIVVFGLLRYLMPFRRWRRWCTVAMVWLGNFWGDGNHAILWLTTKIRWDIQGLEKLDPKKSCLIVSNHQTWVDIIVLQKVLNRKIPLTRYFIKKQLIQIPFIGWALRFLDFPSMNRYSKEQLAKNPELRGRDIEAVQKVCTKFLDIPVTWVNYAEGTRFTFAKQQRSQSPYQYLLPPKAGGVAFILSMVGVYLDYILNMTIDYGKSEPTIWEIFTGKVHIITVHIEKLPITPDLIGDYFNDPQFREHFQLWLNGLWQRKDDLLQQLRNRT